MPTLNQSPTFNNLDTSKSQSAESDGMLIVASLVLDHGYSIDRFATLSRRQKDYIESTLCIIINGLCDHLQTLTSIH